VRQAGGADRNGERVVGKIYTDRALIPGWEIKNPYIKALLKLERLLL
jgi:hypothetical protein